MKQPNNLDHLKSELLAEFEKKFLIHRRNGDVIPNFKRFKTMYVKSFLSSALDTVAEKTKKTAERTWLNRVRELITCGHCNGVGHKLANNLGVSECEYCGGDGHCLHDHEGENIEDILDLFKRDEWLGRGK